MSAIAALVQEDLVATQLDKSKEPYLLICWRSINLIVGNLRVCTMRKDGSGLQWNGSWWKEDSFTTTEEHTRNKVEVLMAKHDLCHDHGGRPRRRNKGGMKTLMTRPPPRYGGSLHVWTWNCCHKSASDVRALLPVHLIVIGPSSERSLSVDVALLHTLAGKVIDIAYHFRAAEMMIQLEQ